MKKYTIDIDEKLWEDFKKTVSKDKTLNQVLIELIKKRVKNAKKKT